MVCWTLLARKAKIIFFLALFQIANVYALESIGKGLLTFTIFGIEIYELELKADKKIKKFSEVKNLENYQMIFTFKKNIKGKYLKTAWTESKKVFPVRGKGDFFDQLEASQPDMKDGDKIVIDAKKGIVQFKFPGNILTFKDQDFKANVPWIWLGNNEVGEKLAPQIFK